MSSEHEPAGEGAESTGSAGSAGKVDGVSLLYIVGGIPAMVAFFVILFVLTRACDLPA